MQTARRRFAADGAIAATLDEIRRDADVSVGALYHHFPDKPALAAAVYAQVMSEYQGVSWRCCAGTTPRKTGFAAASHTTCAGWPPTAARLRCCWATGWTARSCATRTRRSSPPCGIGGVRTTATELLRPMQAGVTAALWFGPAQEFSRHWIAGDEPRMPRGVVKTFADAAWKALRANAIEEDG